MLASEYFSIFKVIVASHCARKFVGQELDRINTEIAIELNQVFVQVFSNSTALCLEIVALKMNKLYPVAAFDIDGDKSRAGFALFAVAHRDRFVFAR